MGRSAKPESPSHAFFRYHGTFDHDELPSHLYPNDHLPKANSVRDSEEAALFLPTLRCCIGISYTPIGSTQWWLYFLRLWHLVMLVRPGRNLLLLLHDGEDRDHPIQCTAFRGSNDDDSF